MCAWTACNLPLNSNAPGSDDADYLRHHPISIVRLVSKERHGHNWLSMVDGLHRVRHTIVTL